MVRQTKLGLAVAIGCLAPSPVGAASVSLPARDDLVQSAILPGGGLAFDRVGISTGVIAAHAYDSAHHDAPEEGVDLFIEPLSGWSSGPPTANLSPADGDRLTSAAISGATVFVAAPGAGSVGSGAVYAFSEPAGGWSGTQHESAKLVASDGGAWSALGSSLSASGSTVVARGGGAVYVFVEPAGGWSGTIREAAKLVGPSGVQLDTARISGDTVVAGGGGAVYVFTKPVTGWSGTDYPAAKLLPSSGATEFGGDFAFGHSVAISGATVAVDGDSSAGGRAYVFTRPAGGWAGTVHERATVGYPMGYYTLPGQVAVSGRTLAVISEDRGYAHECPCQGSLYATSEPPGGWSGNAALGPSAAVSTGGPPDEMALDESTLAVAGLDSVHVFRIIEAPSISGAALGGVRTGKPILRLTAAAGSNGPALRSLTIELPAALSFGHHVGGHVAVRGGPVDRVWVSWGQLHLLLKRPKRRFSITVTAPALKESTSLRRHAVAHRNVTLTLAVSARDSTGRTTSLRTILTAP